MKSISSSPRVNSTSVEEQLEVAKSRIDRLDRRAARERSARKSAEHLLETKSLELYEANENLKALANNLESRVVERTAELDRERKQALHRARYDGLTGIFNRSAFVETLERDFRDLKHSQRRCAVMLIDLDRFKFVNDTKGHVFGDAFLLEFARRLAACIGEEGSVARWGGDEFAVISRNFDRRKVTIKLATLNKPITIKGQSIPCDFSVGYSEFGDDYAGSSETIVLEADLALNEAKRSNTGSLCAFKKSYMEQFEQRNELDAQVRDAIANEAFVPWFQPIYSKTHGCSIGVEMLARWSCPGGEIKTPNIFLPSIERQGLLDAMTEILLRTALPYLRPLVLDGRLDYFTLNVSPHQFNDGWAIERLPILLEEQNFPAHGVMLEITETALLQDVEGVLPRVQSLVEMGLRIALDDFGTGYSNFAMLRKLPISLIKLDRMLVADVLVNDDARVLVESVLDLVRKLRFDVAAEGIEAGAQADLLYAAGCEVFQGFYFARPGPSISKWFGELETPIDLPLRNEYSNTATALQVNDSVASDAGQVRIA